MPVYNLIEYSDNYLKRYGVYGNNTKMNQIITQQTLNHLNLKYKQLMFMVIQKMLK